MENMHTDVREYKVKGFVRILEPLGLISFVYYPIKSTV